MGDFASKPGTGRVKVVAVGVFMLALCLTLAGAATVSGVTSPAMLIAGMDEIPQPPPGSSWAPAPVAAGSLTMVASADQQSFELHTAGGTHTFLPGVDLGSSTPGHLPGDLSISAAQYRAWFAAMSWLGIRVVRVYTIHPPAFYQQLAAYNQANPKRPLYLMQGVGFPDDSYVQKQNLYDKTFTTSVQQELKDAASAVRGDLTRAAQPGRASGTWDTDVTPWLLGWLVGDELNPAAAAASDKRNASAPAVNGKYFRSTPTASPTERWLAARLDELAGYEAAQGVSQPIAFVNWPVTDPLRHPDEPLPGNDSYQLDANHVLPTADWPAGTFASYQAYPFTPDFQRYEKDLIDFPYAGRDDPYAGYLAQLRDHHPDMPTLITEFGVPSSIGSAHDAPLGRSQGAHSEQDAMKTDADLLSMIKGLGLGGGFLFEWNDEWFRSSWNTIAHQDSARRQLWHDPLTDEQGYGLLAMDAAGQPDQQAQRLVDSGSGQPAQQVTATVDESYVNLQIKLGDPAPDKLTLGFDVLPDISGTPLIGTQDKQADASLALDLQGHTGQAYLRDRLDPMPLDDDVPQSLRGATPSGWQPLELIVNRAATVPTTKQKFPIELQNAGALRYGTWDPKSSGSDSRALWNVNDTQLTVRVPWAMLGFADPSSHEVGVPENGKLTLKTSPGITVSLSSGGTTQTAKQLTWPTWLRPYYTERLKQGADQFRNAAVQVTGG